MGRACIHLLQIAYPSTEFDTGALPGRAVRLRQQNDVYLTQHRAPNCGPRLYAQLTEDLEGGKLDLLVAFFLCDRSCVFASLGGLRPLKVNLREPKRPAKASAAALHPTPARAPHLLPPWPTILAFRKSGMEAHISWFPEYRKIPDFRNS